MARLPAPFLFGLVATAAAAAMAGAEEGEEVNVMVAGPPVDVWSAVDQLHKCGDIDVPDVPAKVFNDAGGVTHMVAGSTNFHVMLGTPLNQTRSCKVAWNMTGNPDPGA